MPKADLIRRIDRRPATARGVGGVVVVASVPGSGTTIIANGAFVGRLEGPHAGLFRMADGTVLLRVVDTADVPFLAAGEIDYATNTQFLTIGYANFPGIRMQPATSLPGQAEQRRGLEVDAETLVGMLPPDVIPLDAISSSMVNWGTGADQVSADEIPIADAGGYFATDQVEAALEQLAEDMVYIMANWPA